MLDFDRETFGSGVASRGISSGDSNILLAFLGPDVASGTRVFELILWNEPPDRALKNSRSSPTKPVKPNSDRTPSNILDTDTGVQKSVEVYLG